MRPGCTRLLADGRRDQRAAPACLPRHERWLAFEAKGWAVAKQLCREHGDGAAPPARPTACSIPGLTTQGRRASSRAHTVADQHDSSTALEESADARRGQSVGVERGCCPGGLWGGPVLIDCTRGAHLVVGAGGAHGRVVVVGGDRPRSKTLQLAPFSLPTPTRIAGLFHRCVNHQKKVVKRTGTTGYVCNDRLVN